VIDFEKFKKSLGRTADSLSDEDIERIICIQDQFVEVFVDIWIKKRKQNNFETQEKDGKI
jgi:hypothetical protein